MTLCSTFVPIRVMPASQPGKLSKIAATSHTSSGVGKRSRKRKTIQISKPADGLWKQRILGSIVSESSLCATKSLLNHMKRCCTLLLPLSHSEKSELFTHKLLVKAVRKRNGVKTPKLKRNSCKPPGRFLVNQFCYVQRFIGVYHSLLVGHQFHRINVLMSLTRFQG